MEKQELIKNIENYIFVLLHNPELFHDGIDEELTELLIKIQKYLEKEKK